MSGANPWLNTPCGLRLAETVWKSLGLGGAVRVLERYRQRCRGILVGICNIGMLKETHKGLVLKASE